MRCPEIVLIIHIGSFSISNVETFRMGPAHVEACCTRSPTKFRGHPGLPAQPEKGARPRMKVRDPPQGKRKEDGGGKHGNGDDPERWRQERPHEVRPERPQERHREALHERDLLHERSHEARRDLLHEDYPVRRREPPHDGRRERLHDELLHDGRRERLHDIRCLRHEAVRERHKGFKRSSMLDIRTLRMPTSRPSA